MTEQVLVAIITVAGTATSAFIGIIVSSKMTTYRLGQLEKRVEKHNCILERTAALEQTCHEIEHRIERVEKHIDG